MATINTNVINNVYNLGTNTACDAGTQVCSEGYGLYFPCLKDITRGQDVCFEFYVTDTAAQDVVDLRDVDALTFELFGLYGCSYGTYSYPDYISSLQTEEYELVYENDFDRRVLCNLTVTAIDKTEKGSNAELNKLNQEFYSGTEVTVSAYDTYTHIFVGWAVLSDEGECEGDSWDDYIVSTDNEYTFVINEDIEVFALYRPRKEYNILVDPYNKSSHFVVRYNNVKYHLSHRFDEYCNEDDDDFECLEKVLEGYHIIVECIPNVSVIGEDSDSESGYTYKFVKWGDGNTDRCRIMTVGDDTKIFEIDENIMLYAKCKGPVELYELDKSDVTYFEDFDSEGIHIDTEFNENEIFEYEGDEYTTGVENVYLKYIGEEGVLYFNYGTLSMSSFEIEDGIKIGLYAKAEDEDCDIIVTVNGKELIQTVTVDEYKLYEFYFSHCEQSDIEIKVIDKCSIDKIEISKENIIDKGKAMFCLPSEITSNLPTGALSVGGAIMVNGSSYGLAKTQIGTVNRLNKIILNNV